MDFKNKYFNKSLIIIFAITACKPNNNIYLKNKFDKLEFIWVEDYYSNDTLIQFNNFIDTTITVSIFNNTKRTINVKLDKSQIFLNEEMYNDPIQVEENSLVLRIYDQLGNEIFFRSGFLNLDPPKYDNNELNNLSKYLSIQSKHEINFDQRIKLPVLKSFYFMDLPKHDFLKVRVGKLCLFTGKISDIPGSQKVFCTDSFDIILKEAKYR